MTIQNGDSFIINRNDASYSVEAITIMTNPKIKDDDVFLINRGTSSFKVKAKTVREELGGNVSPPGGPTPGYGSYEMWVDLRKDMYGVPIEPRPPLGGPGGVNGRFWHIPGGKKWQMESWDTNTNGSTRHWSLDKWQTIQFTRKWDPSLWPQLRHLAAKSTAEGGYAGLGIGLELVYTGDKGIVQRRPTELFRTRDYGETWTKLSPPAPEPVNFTYPSYWNVSQSQGQTFLIVGEEGHNVYMTTDGGDTWTKKPNIVDSTTGGVPSGKLAEGDGNKHGWWAICEYKSKYMWVSFDNANTWRKEKVVPNSYNRVIGHENSPVRFGGLDQKQIAVHSGWDRGTIYSTDEYDDNRAGTYSPGVSRSYYIKDGGRLDSSYRSWAEMDMDNFIWIQEWGKWLRAGQGGLWLEDYPGESIDNLSKQKFRVYETSSNFFQRVEIDEIIPGKKGLTIYTGQRLIWLGD